MRETQCHYARQNFRDLANYGVSADDGPEDFRHAGNCYFHSQYD